MGNKSTRNQKNNLEKKGLQEKETFIFFTNGTIVFICGDCMLGFNLQLLLIIDIVKIYVSSTPF